MTIDEFFNTWNNKYCRAPGGLGNQCVDLANEYLVQVLNVPEIHANAIDWFVVQTNFTQVTNTPDNMPEKGDLIVWGSVIGQYGHIAVCSDATVSSFNSFDQNFPTNSPCHFQAHDYTGVLGWLHPNPKASASTPTSNPPIAPNVPLVLSDAQPIQLGGILGILTVGGIRSSLLDNQRDLKSAQGTIVDLTQKLADANKQIAALQLINKTQVSDLKTIADSPSTTVGATTYHVTPIQPVSGLPVASLLSKFTRWLFKQ